MGVLGGEVMRIAIHYMLLALLEINLSALSAFLGISWFFGCPVTCSASLCETQIHVCVTFEIRHHGVH